MGALLRALSLGSLAALLLLGYLVALFGEECTRRRPGARTTVGGGHARRASEHADRGVTQGLIHPCFDEVCSPWIDEAGERIEAHGAGLLQSPRDGRWYWYGESRKTNDLGSHGVNCYSADHLGGPWKREGAVLRHGAGEEGADAQVLRQSDIKVQGQAGPFVIERPKVLYNKKTQKFVMWFHLDDADYKFRHVGVATSDSPSGPFEFLHALQPDGIPSLDMSLWMDVDDKAYFVRSCDNSYMGISGLTDDYLDTTGLLSTGPQLEGMALFRHTNGTLYMMTSHLTGWNPNPLMFFRADGPDLSDPRWVDMGNPTRDSCSFNTQPTYVVPFTTESNQTYFIYMADNWIHGGPRGLIDASYVWLPIRFQDGGVFLDKLEAWDLQDPFRAVVSALSVLV